MRETILPSGFPRLKSQKGYFFLPSNCGTLLWREFFSAPLENCAFFPSSTLMTSFFLFVVNGVFSRIQSEACTLSPSRASFLRELLFGRAEIEGHSFPEVA